MGDKPAGARPRTGEQVAADEANAIAQQADEWSTALQEQGLLHALLALASLAVVRAFRALFLERISSAPFPPTPSPHCVR